MKLTKREIILLSLLIIIAIAFVEFRFVISPGIDKYWQLTEENQALDAEISAIQLDLQLSENAREKRDDYIDQIDQIHNGFLGPLQSSSLFYYSYDVMTRNEFTPGSYTISPITTATPNPDSVSLQEISYQLSEMVTNYKNIRGQSDQSEDSSEDETVSRALADLEFLELMITGSGDYEQIKGLLNDIYEQDKSLLVPYINLSALTSESLGFELRLQYYGVEKFDEEENEYNTWIRPSFDGGITNPFYQDIPEDQDEIETDEDTLTEEEDGDIGGTEDDEVNE